MYYVHYKLLVLITLQNLCCEIKIYFLNTLEFATESLVDMATLFKNNGTVITRLSYIYYERAFALKISFFFSLNMKLI